LATRWSRWAGRLAPGGAALAVALLGLVVGRYHLVQRVFSEQFDPWSAPGIGAQIGLVGVVCGIAAGVAWIYGRALHRRRGLSVMSVAVAVVISIGTATATLTATSPTKVSRVGSGPRDGRQRPNLILIVADTLRSDALGAYRAEGVSVDAMPVPSTPTIDAFATQAVRYTQAFSNSTWTRPSVATILTSLYPSQHRALGKADVLANEVLTLPEVLRDRGYFTAGIVSNINLAPVFNFQQGFDEYQYLPPSFYFGASDSAARLAVYKGLRLLRERLLRDRLTVHHYYQDAEVVNRHAFAWIEESPAQPFFLLIHYMDPHDPYFEMPYNGRGVARVSNPNPDVSAREHLQELYSEDVGYLDAELGKLFAKLREADLYDTSVIALVADHGEEFHEHGGWWHGATLYREQMQVPMLIKLAGREPSGATDGRLVTTLDLAPTLMSAIGERPPDSFLGRDLLTTPMEGEGFAMAEEDFEGNVLRSLRVGDWKLITANQGNPRGLAPIELYDVRHDPGERTNLAGREGPRVDELLRRLSRHRLEGARPNG